MQEDILPGSIRIDEDQDPSLNFAQTTSSSESEIILDEKEKVGTETELESNEKSHFFYVDDFFHWLGCKFVTCDKEKKDES